MSLWLFTLLPACGQQTSAQRDRALEAARARADHAAHCLNLTAAIASLPAGPVRDRAVERDLDRITPDLASRWVPAWKHAAEEAELSAQDAARTLSRNGAAIADAAAVDRFTDEAIECGSEVDGLLHE